VASSLARTALRDRIRPADGQDPGDAVSWTRFPGPCSTPRRV